MTFKKWKWYREILEPGNTYQLLYNRREKGLLRYIGILEDIDERYMYFANERRISYFTVISIEQLECQRKNQHITRN